MIVLMVSAAEVQALIDGKPDQALKVYLARACRDERLMPDDNLPTAVLLREVGLRGDRDYVAVIRLFDTAEAADRAWEQDVQRLEKTA